MKTERLYVLDLNIYSYFKNSDGLNRKKGFLFFSSKSVIE